MCVCMHFLTIYHFDGLFLGTMNSLSAETSGLFLSALETSELLGTDKFQGVIVQQRNEH